MRILVFEFVTGGGLAGRPVPRSLAREGRAMRDALVQDLAAMARHRIAVTVDPRFPGAASGRASAIDAIGVEPGRSPRDVQARLDRAIASADAVWLIAPETGGCLEWLAERVVRLGPRLLGSGAAAIRRACDKAALARRLTRHGVPHPATYVVGEGEDPIHAARRVGYPLVVKPARGAGCRGVGLVRAPCDLSRAVAAARAAARLEGVRAPAAATLVVQRYVRGQAASVSLVTDGPRARVLSVQSQEVRVSRTCSYRGGRIPCPHPLAGRAAEVAVRACALVGGLRGFVGVDLVLTGEEAYVIEINPRLTTAYLGIRAALQANVAALAVEACGGRLPTLRPPCAPSGAAATLAPFPSVPVRFTAGGAIVPAWPS